MKYFLLLTTTCVDDITSCCSDYGLATYLHIVKEALNIIHLVVPIILIIMLSVDFAKMVINPNDPQKKKSTSIKNKFIAAVFIFFIPYIVGLLLSLISGSMSDISGCWNSADEIFNTMRETEPYRSKNITSNTASDSTLDFSSNKVPTKEDKNSSSKNSSTTKGQKVANYAKEFVGKSYVYGGSWNGEKPYTPTDCSGFVQGVYKHFRINLPRTAAAQSKTGKHVASLKNAQPGDLLFYKAGDGSIGHVTMYIGNNKVIHASGSKTGIKISNVNYRAYSFIRRII